MTTETQPQSPAAAPKPASSLAARLWASNKAWMGELVLVFAMYTLYSITRSAAPDRISLANSHAVWIERVEHDLRINIELTLNKLFVAHEWLADFGSVWYQLAHMLVTFGLLAWLFFMRRKQYGMLRSSLALLWLAGLTTYWLYPLSPPRFHLAGAVDTMTEYPILFAGKRSVAGLANLYAAMPSLHIGWSTWVALAWVYTHKGPWRHLAWIHPILMSFVVMGTANHYILDCIAGAIYATVCFVVTKTLYDRLARRKAARAAFVDKPATAQAAT